MALLCLIAAQLAGALPWPEFIPHFNDYTHLERVAGQADVLTAIALVATIIGEGGSGGALAIAVGDALLRSIATHMRQCLRETDTIARLGGDE